MVGQQEQAAAVIFRYLAIPFEPLKTASNSIPIAEWSNSHHNSH
jgi:hypothetical protein